MSKRASRSSQAGPSKRSRLRLSSNSEPYDSEAVAGKILHISLRNFMCHGGFKLDFNQRMNFVLGHNGSGKSGILTAIMIGLGGTAKSTNRSNNISKLVKNGEHSAVIEIHICNQGPEAFEPHIYGNRIIVIRTILAAGGGNYRILDASRHEVSKSKNKLALILRYFEITVNNPITILTQDCARTFLRDSDSKARFKLFKKGSGLEVIEEEMATCLELQRGIEMELKRRREKSKYFQSEYKDRMRIYEMLESAERARERTVELQRELKWVAIQEEEKTLEKANVELEKRVSKLAKHSTEVQELSSKKQAIEKTIQQLATETAKVENARDSHGTRISAKKQAMQEKRNEFFSTRKKFLGIDSRVKQLRTDIQTIDESIAEVTQQEARDQYEQQVVELEAQKTRHAEEIEQKTQAMRAAQTQITELEEKLSQVQSTKKKRAMDVATCREQMNQIKNETDSLAVYGSHIPQFVKALERNKGRFSQMPLGPIGRYIEVPDTRYKGVIEQLISGSLSSFIINTARDQEVFIELFNKECRNQRLPGVIQRKFRYEAYDTSRHGVQVPRNTTTPLLQMRCKNTVVLNTLIDMHRVEQVLICDGMDMGRKLTENIENVPRNLKRVLVMEPNCEVYPQPNFRIYSSAPRRCKFIQVSADEKRTQLKEQFDEFNRQLEEAKQAVNYTESMTLKLKQTRSKLQSEVQGMARKKRDIESQISEIQEQYLGPRTEADTLIEEKERLESQLENLTIEYAPQKAKMDDLTKALADMDKDIKATEAMNAEYEEKLEEARERLSAFRGKLADLELTRTDKAEVLREMEQQVVSQRTLAERKKVEVDEMISTAGERKRTRKTADEVREAISHLSAQRAVSTQITETREEVMAELTVLEQKVEELNTEFELGKETLKVQEAAVRKHQRDYDNRKRVVKQRMSEKFRELLAQQSYTGDLKIDYERSTLELEINPRASGTVQGTKSLSGGERSFSTVAFLLSIWSCIEHPFFLLDEYDVFTDGSNRELMTRMLIQEAMAKPKNQYMFLTPQDVSHLIQPSPELEVFKMPEKN